MSRQKTESKSKQMKSKTASAKRVKNASSRVRGAQARSGRKGASKKSRTRSSKTSALTRRTAHSRSAVNPEEELTQVLRGRRQSSAGMTPGRQTGDLQGLSRRQEADSESVDELVEEGNPFEAGAIAGVEEADNADESEVHTHEVAEDDVPEE